MYEAAEALRQRGELGPADAMAKRLLARLRRSKDDTRLDQSLVQQLRARLAMERGDLLCACRCYRRALAVLPRRPRKGQGPDEDQAPVLRYNTLVFFAEALSRRGRYVDAADTLEQAVRLPEKRLSLDDAEKGRLFNQLGMACKFAARFRRAERVYGEALRLFRKVHGETSDAVANVYHNLGGLEHARGRPHLAEAPARRSVELHTAVFGTDHESVALDEAALAAILDAVGKTDEAERLFRKALDVFTRLHGPEHYEVAVNLHNLAALYHRQGKLDEAEPLYRRALALRLRLLGKQHPEVALTLHNLAALCQKSGRRAQARRLYARALRILRPLPSRHPLRRACKDGLAALALAL